MKILSLGVNPRTSPQRVMMIGFTAILFVFGFAVLAQARGISIENATASEVQGNYTIIAYGCESTSESPSLAILKKEGAAYDFDFVAEAAFFWGTLPELETRMVTGMPAAGALATATNFVKCNPDVQDVEINRIAAPDGSTLGYEVRPVYMPLRYGSAGLISTTYKLEENQVLAAVGMNPLAEKNDWGGG